MRDNSKKKLQKNTDYIIQKELEEAARKVEEEMGAPADTPLRAKSNGDEEFQKLMQAAREKGLVGDAQVDVFEDSAAEKTRQRKKRARRILKYAAIVVLCGAGVFGVSMTSEANRLWLVSSAEKIFSDSAQVVVNNDENRVKYIADEKEAAEVIEKEIGIKVPEFYYTPPKMNFDKYEYDVENKVAIMYFLKDEQIITLYMSDSNRDTTEVISYDGELSDENTISFLYGDCTMWKTQAQGEEIPSYMGQWSYHNGLYRIWGRLTEEEMKELLEGIMFW